MTAQAPDPLKLENQLCFPLYACSRELIKKYHPFLEPLGLTYTQYVTMMVFWEHRELSVKELGKRLFLDSGTLTPVLKSLESKGFITRRRSAADERLVIATVTEAGMALRGRAAEIPQKVGCQLCLTPDESIQLYALLYKLLGVGAEQTAE